MREGSLRPLTESYDSIAGEHQPFQYICKVKTSQGERRGAKAPNGWKGEGLWAVERDAEVSVLPHGQRFDSAVVGLANTAVREDVGHV